MTQTMTRAKVTKRYRGVSYIRPIEAAREAVSVEELADRLCGPGVRRQGADEVYFLCPLHDDHTPSLRVSPTKNLWYCDPCVRGGDVVELYMYAEGYYPSEAHTAAAMLLMEFGHEVPQRPPAWFRRQERQKPIRDAIEQARLEHLQRRLFRVFFKPSVLAIEDEEEREAEYRILWDVSWKLAKLLRYDLEVRRSA